jgi:tetratricopeptide (TPR) repeat protein
MTMLLLRSNRLARIVLPLLTISSFATIGNAGAQQTQQSPAPPKNGAPSLQPAVPDAAQPAPPKVDPLEEAAYRAFYQAMSPQDDDKKIQIGEDFVGKYPASRYNEGIYASLVQMYAAKQNWDKFYAAADKALALDPNDASVLTTVGWVIPHLYNPSDPNADSNLMKAEDYEKRSVELVGTMAKPPAMTDEQFAASKTEDLALAHSGLGLVYFRRQKYDESAKELKQATEAAATPDPSDFYVLGIDLQALKQNAEAADAFDRCAQIAGNLQGECKRRSDAMKQSK